MTEIFSKYKEGVFPLQANKITWYNNTLKYFVAISSNLPIILYDHLP